MEIETAEDAVNAAERFLDRYYVFRKLETVKREGETWTVEFNVTIIGPPETVRIAIDSKTGAVVEYEKPKGK